MITSVFRHNNKLVWFYLNTYISYYKNEMLFAKGIGGTLSVETMNLSSANRDEN